MPNKIEIDTASEDLVTQQRLEKGDLEASTNAKGYVTRVVMSDLPVIKILVEKELFPRHYEIYGVGFLELQMAYVSPWTAKSSAVMLEQWGKGVSASSAIDIYQNVCRALGVMRKHTVEYILNTKTSEFTRRFDERTGSDIWDLEKAEKHKNLLDYYASCFDVLVESMDFERERFLKNN